MLAHVAGLPAEFFASNRGEVLEDQRQTLVDQQAKPPDDHRIDLVLVVHQGFKAAQQLLVRDRLRPEVGQRHRLDPGQQAELGSRPAQPVEHDQPDERFNVRSAARAAEHPPEPREAQRYTELGQGPHVTERARTRTTPSVPQAWRPSVRALGPSAGRCNRLQSGASAKVPLRKGAKIELKCRAMGN